MDDDMVNEAADLLLELIQRRIPEREQKKECRRFVEMVWGGHTTVVNNIPLPPLLTKSPAIEYIDPQDHGTCR